MLAELNYDERTTAALRRQVPFDLTEYFRALCFLKRFGLGQPSDLLVCDNMVNMTYERLKYSGHARRRMKQRRISHTDVLGVLNQPGITYPS